MQNYCDCLELFITCRLAAGRGLTVQFHILLQPVIDQNRRRSKVVAEQYCKISPLICMVCLFLDPTGSLAFTLLVGWW